MKKNNIRTLVECAVMVALAVVLSLVKIWKMPLGGAVTLVSMLPICIVSIRHGAKWGFGTSFVYALIQLIFGITLDGLFAWGLTPVMLIGCMLFDYIIAFTVLGVAGCFRNKGEAGAYIGIAVALVLRFVSHFCSGYIIFANLEQWELFGKIFENKPALYSAAYNGLYMLPELIITLVVAVILMRVPSFKSKILGLARK